MKLENKVAIITGGASGIGKAMAVMFAKEGASIVIGDLNESAAGEVVGEIEAAGGKALAVSATVKLGAPLPSEPSVSKAVELISAMSVNGLVIPRPASRRTLPEPEIPRKPTRNSRSLTVASSFTPAVNVSSEISAVGVAANARLTSTCS